MDKVEIFEAIEQLRRLGFGVTLGTVGESDYSLRLVYWPNPEIEIKPIEGPLEHVIAGTLFKAQWIAETYLSNSTTQ